MREKMCNQKPLSLPTTPEFINSNNNYNYNKNNSNFKPNYDNNNNNNINTINYNNSLLLNEKYLALAAEFGNNKDHIIHLTKLYKKQLCFRYLNNNCSLGKNCKFYHPIKCKNYNNNNGYNCIYKDKCRYAHVVERYPLNGRIIINKNKNSKKTQEKIETALIQAKSNIDINNISNNNNNTNKDEIKTVEKKKEGVRLQQTSNVVAQIQNSNNNKNDSKIVRNNACIE